MSWRRIVIRPDSIIRWWSLAQLDCPDGFSHVLRSPHFKDINFNSLIAFSDGSEHIRLDEFGTLNAGLIKASEDHPSLFQDIGKYYEGVISRWLTFCASISSMKLEAMSNTELGEVLGRFTDLYKEFSPILFVPFVVERRYSTEYPAMLKRLAERVRADWNTFVSGFPTQTRELLSETNESDLGDVLRSMLEYSPRRTIAEEKDFALQTVAAHAEADPDVAPLFKGSEPPEWESITDASARIADELSEALREYKWMAHWGYPPKVKDSSMSEFIEDLHVQVQRGAAATLRQWKDQELESKQGFSAVAGWLTDAERQLIDDINYYNYLRTARMEAKIRAQYLSVPLFAEIQRRGEQSGKFGRHDVYLLVPPEIQEFLKIGKIPRDLVERRSGWALVTHAARGEWRVLAGKEKEAFEDRFYSVIDCRENARGLHNPTAAFVGGKGEGLFHLLEAGCDVPPFFVVTSEAFRRVMQFNELEQRIPSILAGAHSGDDRRAAAQQCRTLITGCSIPAAIEEAITELFPQLSAERVAVRSSATVEDAEEASWAGRFETQLDVTAIGLMAAIKKVWASLFTERSLTYAAQEKIDLSNTPMAVVVQAMVDAEASGVMNTVFDGSNQNIVEIEAAFGYGAAVVDGEVTPDRYLVDVEEGTMVDRHIARQERLLTQSGWQSVEVGRAALQKMPDEMILELARLGKKLERELGGPQDVEFAVVAERVAIVQSRALTGLENYVASQTGTDIPPGARLVASGLKGKTAAVLRGTCQVLTDLAQADRFHEGNILVVTAATPAWDGVVSKASALVTNDGGATSHAIRVANERRIPVVVGTTSATEVIPDGSELVVNTAGDPFKGRVYQVR